MREVVAFNSYALYVVMAFVLLLMIFVMLPRAQVSAGRINEVLNSDIAVREGKDDGRQTEEKGSITFNDVSFRYPGAAENCLEHISFQVNQARHLPSSERPVPENQRLQVWQQDFTMPARAKC